MVQAAATGAVDFSQADPRNPNWYRRLRLLLNEVEQQSMRDYLSLSVLKLSPLLTLPNRSDSAMANLATELSRFMTLYQDTLFPWLSGKADEPNVDKLKDQWVSVYGDPSDPEVAANIAATAAALWAENKAVAVSA